MWRVTHTQLQAVLPVPAAFRVGLHGEPQLVGELLAAVDSRGFWQTANKHGEQEVLRARRMLVERGAVSDGGGGIAAISPSLRQGIDSFLAELSLSSGGALPLLDVCAFCTQFIPSTYRDPVADQREDEERRSASAQLRPTRSARARSTHPSSLVIQHHLAATGAAAMSTPQPHPPPSFRLLSSDAARVLRIDAPNLAAAAARASTGPLRSGLREKQTPGTGPVDALQDLSARSRRESAAILRDNQQRARHPFPLKSIDEPHHVSNIIMQVEKRAESLYSGGSVVRSLLLGRPTSAADAASIASGLTSKQQAIAVAPNKERAKVVPAKHGRHWKTELRFPPAVRLSNKP